MKEYEFILRSGKKAIVMVYGQPDLMTVRNAIKQYVSEILNYDSQLIYLLEKDNSSVKKQSED